MSIGRAPNPALQAIGSGLSEEQRCLPIPPLGTRALYFERTMLGTSHSTASDRPAYQPVPIPPISPHLTTDQRSRFNPHSVEVGARFSPIHF